MDIQALGAVTLQLGKPGFAAGTTTTYTITTAFNFSIKGKTYTKSAASNAAQPATDVVTGAAFLPVAANKECVFLYGVGSDGTVKVVQGSIVNNGTAGSSISTVPDDFCPFAYLKIEVAVGGTTFTLGSSNSSGVSGVTYTRQDLTSLPDRLVS
jgi:hypothetical protein